MHHLFAVKSRVQKAMLLSMLAAIITMALKFLAWSLTGSVGLLSDAMESLVNLSAAILGFVLLGLAAQPADDEHPFGHEKAEYFASGAEGMLILMASLMIGWQAMQGLLMPQPPEALSIGLVLSLIATGVNAVAAWWLMRVAHQERSLAVEADAHHLLTDVWTSVGVVGALGLMLIFPTAWWLDPAIALLVAANIMRTAFELMTRSFDGLMDVQLPHDELTRVREIIQQTLPANTSSHALRTRRAGRRRFVEFHLDVPGEWSVMQSHTLCDQLEDVLNDALEDCDVVIHVEPAEAHTSRR